MIHRYPTAWFALCAALGLLIADGAYLLTEPAPAGAAVVQPQEPAPVRTVIRTVTVHAPATHRPQIVPSAAQARVLVQQRRQAGPTTAPAVPSPSATRTAPIVTRTSVSPTASASPAPPSSPAPICTYPGTPIPGCVDRS